MTSAATSQAAACAAEDTLREGLVALGLDASGWQSLSTFGGPHSRRGAYAVQLRDGLRVKARVLLDDATLERVQSLQAQLAGAALAQRLWQHGRLLVDAWVEGEPLQHDACRAEDIDAAAALLADIHRRGRAQPATDAASLAARRAELETLTATARDRLLQLAADGVVSASLASRMTAALHEHSLQAASAALQLDTGILHGDLCAANLVREPNGRLVAVDNEALDRGFLDYDLGMTWYRWPLREPDAERFERVYAQHAQRQPRAGMFFRIVALTKGLWVRSQVDPSSLHIAQRRASELKIP
jgi:aminoglycoside phosphotransferase (APT) family kinase protein